MPTSTITAAVEKDAAVVDLNADNAVVHVIQSSYHHRDRDNRPVSEDDILVDEGWFTDLASAAERCEQLNAQNRTFYDTRMAALKREHDAKIRLAKKQNHEAEAIRAAGMKKPDVAVPPAFVPEAFEKFFKNSSHTSYEAVEIRRSDHDGIARAASSGPAQDDAVGSSAEVNTEEGAAAFVAG